MYMHFDEDGVFQGLYATYEDMINPNIRPIIQHDGTPGSHTVELDVEKYFTPDGKGTAYRLMKPHVPHYI